MFLHLMKKALMGQTLQSIFSLIRYSTPPSLSYLLCSNSRHFFRGGAYKLWLRFWEGEAGFFAPFCPCRNKILPPAGPLSYKWNTPLMKKVLEAPQRWVLKYNSLVSKTQHPLFFLSLVFIRGRVKEKVWGHGHQIVNSV